MISSQLQGVIGTWAMSAVGLIVLFVPINDAQATALTGFAAVTVTLLLLIFNKAAPDTIDKDPAADFERARVRLARHAGIMMPSIEEAATPGTTIAPDPPKEGWPPPQDNS